MSNENKVQRALIDWEAVEHGFRSGIFSIREIARIHGISDKAIRNKARDSGWERDLSAKVNEKVRSDLVRSESAPADCKTEREIIDVAAATVVSVVRGHRKAICRGMSLVERLTEQLSDAINSRAELEGYIDVETADDKSTERKSRMKKAVSLEKHAQIATSLAQASKIWVEMERKAFNIADTVETGRGYDMSDDQRRARLAELQAKLNAAD